MGQILVHTPRSLKARPSPASWMPTPGVPTSLCQIVSPTPKSASGSSSRKLADVVTPFSPNYSLTFTLLPPAPSSSVLQP